MLENFITRHGKVELTIIPSAAIYSRREYRILCKMGRGGKCTENFQLPN